MLLQTIQNLIDIYGYILTHVEFIVTTIFISASVEIVISNT